MSISERLLQACGIQQQSGTLPWKVSRYILWAKEPSALTNQGLWRWETGSVKRLWVYFARDGFANGGGGGGVIFTAFPSYLHEPAGSCSSPSPQHCSVWGSAVSPLVWFLSAKWSHRDQSAWLLTPLPRILCELKWVIAPRKATACVSVSSFVCAVLRKGVGGAQRIGRTPGAGGQGVRAPLPGTQAPSHALVPQTHYYFFF